MTTAPVHRRVGDGSLPRQAGARRDSLDNQRAPLDVKNPAGVRTALWRPPYGEPIEFQFDRLSEYLADDDALFWVDICNHDPRLLSQLASELSDDGRDPQPALTEKTISEAVDVGPKEGKVARPRVARYKSHVFVDVHNLRWNESVSGVAIDRVFIFVLSRGLVTVRKEEGMDVDAVLARWTSNPQLLRHGVGALLYGLLEAVVDSHFETIQAVEDWIESLDEKFFTKECKPEDLQEEIHHVRTTLVDLRRVVVPMPDVVDKTDHDPRGGGSQVEELDELYDELKHQAERAAEWTDSLRDLVTALHDTDIALQDALLNRVMKKLAAWAAIIAVPTLVTGWFGQNVDYPGLNQPAGLIYSTMTIAAIALLVFVVFKNKKWL